MDRNLDMSIKFLDDRGITMDLKIPFKNMMFDAQFGCELGIYDSDALDADTWFIGTQILQDKVVTFDASLKDEGISDGLFVGIRQL